LTQSITLAGFVKVIEALNQPPNQTPVNQHNAKHLYDLYYI